MTRRRSGGRALNIVTEVLTDQGIGKSKIKRALPRHSKTRDDANGGGGMQESVEKKKMRPRRGRPTRRTRKREGSRETAARSNKEKADGPGRIDPWIMDRSRSKGANYSLAQKENKGEREIFRKDLYAPSR